MTLFFVLPTRNLSGMVMSFLLMCSFYSSAQLPQPISDELLVRQQFATTRLQPIHPPSRTAIRLLKKERRKMQKLSTLLKRRATRTNIPLAASEIRTQQSTDRLIHSLSNEIDSLKRVRSQLTRGSSNDKTALPSRKEAIQALSNPSLSTNSVTEKRPLPELADAGQVKDLEKLPRVDQLKTSRLDTVSVDQFLQKVVQKTKYGQQVDQLEETRKGMEQAQKELLNKEVGALPNKEQLQNYAQAKAAKLATSEFTQLAPQIQQAQQKFTTYKRKMEWLKEGSGKHANSLKGDSLSKRLLYGGNFQIPSLRPFSIVVAPFVGYKLNKKISMGLSISYKSILGTPAFPTKALGGEIGLRGFAEYKLIKSWFAHCELERMRQSTSGTHTDGDGIEWQNKGYVGIGRQIGTIKGVKITTLFLCNLFDKRVKNFEPAAFQWRFGISK